jgi:hypothetical protein
MGNSSKWTSYSIKKQYQIKKSRIEKLEELSKKPNLSESFLHSTQTTINEHKKFSKSLGE